MRTAGETGICFENTPEDDTVIKATEKFKLVMFQSRQTMDDRESRATGSGTKTIYVDLNRPRVREEERGEVVDKILDYSYTAVYDYPRDRFMGLLSQELVVEKDQARDEVQRRHIRLVETEGLAKKKAVLSHIARTKTDDLPPMSLVGKDGFINRLRELQASKNTLSTLADLDGRDATKYCLKEREGNMTTSLWVDPLTKLPIRVEIELIDPTPRIARNEWVFTDFEWDPEVADTEKLFSTDPPPGFAVEDRMTES